MSLTEKEKKVEMAGEKLGQLMKEAGVEKKKILRKIMDGIKKHAEEQEEKGEPIDPSSLYAAAIILDDELMADDQMTDAAKEYIEAEHEYIQELHKGEEA